MIISPQIAIDKGYITGDITDTNVQQNGIDFTLDTLFSINRDKTFRISEDAKEMRGGTQLTSGVDTRDGKSYFYLEANGTYDMMSNFHVNLPEDISCTLIIRSSLNRNGLFITSGHFDSGYNNKIGCVIHNRSGVAMIEQGMRVGQIMFHTSESAKLYDGLYNEHSGEHWSVIK